MAPRRYYRRRRRYYRSYRPRWRRRSWRPKVINATSRSKVSVKCQRESTMNVDIPANNYVTPTFIVSPFVEGKTYAAYAQCAAVCNVSTWNSPMCCEYCKLYDEVKCDSFTVHVTLTNMLNQLLTPGSLRVYTAWDRKFCYYDILEQTERFPTAANILNSSSMAVTNFSENSVCQLSRSITASDFMEKYTYVDTAARENELVRIWGYDCRIDCLGAWKNADGNIPWFSPALYFFVACPGNTVSAIPIQIMVHLTAIYSFRGPRWAGDDDVLKKEQKVKVEQTISVPIGERAQSAVALADETATPVVVSTSSEYPDGTAMIRSLKPEEAMDVEMEQREIDLDTVPPPRKKNVRRSPKSSSPPPEILRDG